MRDESPAPRMSDGLRSRGRPHRRAFALLAMVAGGASCAGGGARPGPTAAELARVRIQPILVGTHSHNDFERKRPLLDALGLGMASIEVDVALVDGVFYVTHDSSKIRRDRTLVDMYLDPLRQIADRRRGTIYGPNAPPLQLLIDVKSDAGTAYEALDALLAGYAHLLTRWSGTTVTTGPVTAVLSGRRASEPLRDASQRFLALDGRIWEDRTGYPTGVMPLVSINWDDTIGPGGRWHTTERLATARRYIDDVHAEGRAVRFWGTPDQPEVWSELRARGVDFIGADDIRRLADFVRPEQASVGSRVAGKP